MRMTFRILILATIVWVICFYFYQNKTPTDSNVSTIINPAKRSEEISMEIGSQGIIENNKIEEGNKIIVNKKINEKKEINKKQPHKDKFINEDYKSNVDTDYSYFFYINNHAYICPFYIVLDDLNRTNSLEGITVSIYVRNGIKLEHEKIEKYTDHYQVIYYHGHRQNKIQYYLDTNVKLYAFNHTEYKKIMIIDTDVRIKNKISHLFDYPEDLIIPNAYWLKTTNGKPFLTSLLLAATPNHTISAKIEHILKTKLQYEDMDAVNDLYIEDIIRTIRVLPREYAILTSLIDEFNMSDEEWGKVVAYHFTGPKPWFQGIRTCCRGVYTEWNDLSNKLCY